MPQRQQDRLARHVAVQFEEGDHRAREGDRADRDAEPHLDPADRDGSRPSASTIPKASGLRKAAAPTSTAAMPTRLWKAATSCGIAVIAIRRAVTRPIAAPIAIAPGSGRSASSRSQQPERDSSSGR